MSFLGAVFNPSRLFNVGLAFMTGGMSLYMQIARELFTAVAQEFIQRLGTRLGLPQPLIDMAMAGASAQMGDPLGVRRPLESAAQALTQVGYTPQQVGDVLREADEAIANLINQGLTQAGAGDDDFRAAGASGGKSFLVALGIALGKALDKQLNKMFDLSQKIGALGDKPDNKSKIGEYTGELQARGQIASMLSNALKNSLESVGQAGTTLARRG
jgi:hypothetical protein